MSEATTLVAESPQETQVRLNIKSRLEAWVAGETALFNSALLHLVPGIAGIYLADVMAIPQVLAWEKAELEKAVAALVDLSFWAADSLEVEFERLLKSKLHIDLSAQHQAQVTAAGSNGVALEPDEVHAIVALGKAAFRARIGL